MVKIGYFVPGNLMFLYKNYLFCAQTTRIEKMNYKTKSFLVSQ